MSRSIYDELSGLNLKIEENVIMAPYTTFKIGGAAKYMVTPADEEALSAVLSYAKKENVQLFILGGGSNILVSDDGFDGIVVNMTEGFTQLSLTDENTIYAGAGVKLSKIAQLALNNSLEGFEFAGGIPGTLGGGIYMNAGAYGGELKDVVVRTKYMTADGEIRHMSGEEHGFGYRTSAFCGTDSVILGAYIVLHKGDSDKISEKMRELSKKRIDKQPLSYPSAGSTFKRPEGDFAGRLIEASGMKGYKIGGAQVSEKHAGFVINTGGATANDVYSLINHVSDEVYRLEGVRLEAEVKLIGRF